MLQLYLSSKNYRLALGALLLAGVMALLFISWQGKRKVVAELDERLARHLQLRAGLLKDQLLLSKSQVGFLHATLPAQGRAHAVLNNRADETTPIALWQQRLQIIFKAYAEQYPQITQIRYLVKSDAGGIELARAQSPGTLDTGPQPTQTDTYLLATRLAENEIYLTDFRFQTAEDAAWPTYSAMQSVFDSNGEFFGVIVIDYDARHMLAHLSDALYSEFSLFLLNAEGQFIIDTETDQTEFSTANLGLDWTARFGAQAHNAPDNTITHIKDRINGQDYHYLGQTMTGSDGFRWPSLHLGLAYKGQHILTEVFARQLIPLAFVALAFGAIFILLLMYRKYSQKSHEEMVVKARLQAFVNGSKDAIVTMTTDGTVTSCNSATCTMFELLESDIIDKPFLPMIIPPATLERANEAFNKVVDSRALPSFEFGVVNASGQTKHLYITLSSKVSPSGELFGVAAIIRDVTDARELQQHLKTLNDQLRRKNTDMEHFVAAISHDLRTPLVTIGGFSEQILSSGDNAISDKNLHRLNRIVANTTQMELLLEELLKLSQVIHQELTLSLCNIERCVDELLEMFGSEIQSKRIQVRKHFQCTELYANKNLLQQCLQNLVGNAIKYRREDVTSIIELFAYQQDETFVVGVKDNGPGIDAKYHDQVFKLFERVSDGQGTGIGLTIVKSAMEKHRGWVTLESEPGQGCVFKLHFPVPPSDRAV